MVLRAESLGSSMRFGLGASAKGVKTKGRLKQFAFKRLVKQSLNGADARQSRPGVLAAERHLAYVYGICQGWLMVDQRHVKLFRNGRNQAVRIPVEFELPGDEAIMHRDGDRLVIEPLRKRGLIALLATMKPLDEDLPEIEDRPPPAENVF
jgi:antitoxin VapB